MNPTFKEHYSTSRYITEQHKDPDYEQKLISILTTPPFNFIRTYKHIFVRNIKHNQNIFPFKRFRILYTATYINIEYPTTLKMLPEKTNHSTIIYKHKNNFPQIMRTISSHLSHYHPWIPIRIERLSKTILLDTNTNAKEQIIDKLTIPYIAWTVANHFDAPGTFSDLLIKFIQQYGDRTDYLRIMNNLNRLKDIEDLTPTDIGYII